MVIIELKNDKLEIILSGNDFAEMVESIKYVGARWNQSKKVWEIHVSKFDKVFSEMSEYGVDLSENVRYEIKEYFENLKELKKITKRQEYRKFDNELMLIPPL